jgi:hypothetical protein
MEIGQYNTMMKALKRNKKLEEALEDIRIETTEDIAGLPRDEALNVITWIRERAREALEQEV